MNKVIFSIFALLSICEVDGQNKRLSAAKMFFDEQIDLKSWMETSWDKIKDKKLKDIKIPGTHDSGTAVISKENAVVSTDGRAPGVAKLGPSAIVKWSKTQSVKISKQLEFGVRFLDFRVSLEPDNELYLSHGLRGEKLSNVLNDIKAFCAKNKKEIIIIKVKGFADKKCEKRNLNEIMAKEFSEHINSLLLNREAISNGGLDLPNTTIDQIIKTGKRVIVLFDKKLKGKNTGEKMNSAYENHTWLFDAQKLIESPWANTYSVDKLVDFTNKSITNIGIDKLHALHWTLTADAKYIVTHLMSDGIKHMTDKLDSQGNLDKTLNQMKRINIVEFDFITPEKARNIINRNTATQESKKDRRRRHSIG